MSMAVRESLGDPKAHLAATHIRAWRWIACGFRTRHRSTSWSEPQIFLWRSGALQRRNKMTSGHVQGTKQLVSLSTIGSAAMTTPVAESACAFAWRNYLLFHSCVSENDDRRDALRLTSLTFAKSAIMISITCNLPAVTYLKKLDESP